jgi:hypothetical protein
LPRRKRRLVAHPADVDGVGAVHIVPDFTPEQYLYDVLYRHSNEREVVGPGDFEEPLDTLGRIIRERDKAFLLLALDRLKEVRHL